MKVLLIGGTGHISTEVSRLAVKKGIQLFLLNRGSNSQFIPPEAACIKADMRNIEDVRKKLKGLRFDVIADFITFNPEQLTQRLNLFRDICEQYIFVSSTTVYKPSLNITEDNTPVTNVAWDYPRNKIACEQLLAIDRMLHGTNHTIVRPCETYGDIRIPGVFVPQPEHWSIIDRMMRGKPVVVHDDGSAIRTFTHSSDFAKGFIGLFLNTKAYGEAFNITSDEVLSWREITEMVADAAGIDPSIEYIPSLDIVRIMPKTTYGDTYGVLLCAKAHNVTINSSKIKALVPGFNCTTKFYDGIRRTIRFFKDNPEFQQVNHEWDYAMDNLIDTYSRKFV
jgi:nucleoside-diphosphate-sugar epimerase